MVLDLMRDLEDCVMSDYGRLLIYKLECTKLHILNGTHVFLMTNVLTCLLTSSGGSVVHYVLVKVCDASILNKFNIGPLSLDSDHKPLYLHNVTKTHTLTKRKRDTICDLATEKLICKQMRLTVM